MPYLQKPQYAICNKLENKISTLNNCHLYQAKCLVLTKSVLLVCPHLYIFLL